MLSRDLPIVDRIDLVVREHPDADALATPERTLTYREFGKYVEEFALELERRTAPGEFVGIEADRRAGSIVAMVGALRAGRPFVFLDPRDSEASNSAKAGLLGVRLLARCLPGQQDPDLVPARWATAAGPSPAGLDEVRSELAYAIHTSGSTGEPKCVLVRAAALVPVVHDHVERLEVGPGCRTLQFARLTFDGCVTEILWTLTSGACLVVVDESLLTPGPVLRGTLERFGITHVKTTPFALTATEPGPGTALRHVLNGGGACRPSVVRRWSAVAAFHNAYGTTETTICNLLSDPLDPGSCASEVPLGERVGDCGLRVDGEGGRGELVVTGDSVAVGYLAEDGVRPFGDEYRTGDVVEEREDGLHFVERVDRQVKVRGYRVDPGEVENAVCGLTGVLDAVVVAEAHDGGDAAADALVCYFRGGVSPRALREHLESALDPYKVPSVLTRVEEFPHTPNGKVDRDALRADRRAGAGGGSGGDPVLELVHGLTGIDDVTLDDNFFDVGGDSASAVVLVTRLKELGWVDVGVRDVLRADTLRDLSERLPERSV